MAWSSRLPVALHSNKYKYLTTLTYLNLVNDVELVYSLDRHKCFFLAQRSTLHLLYFSDTLIYSTSYTRARIGSFPLDQK